MLSPNLPGIARKAIAAQNIVTILDNTHVREAGGDLSSFKDWLRQWEPRSRFGPSLAKVRDARCGYLGLVRSSPHDVFGSNTGTCLVEDAYFYSACLVVVRAWVFGKCLLFASCMLGYFGCAILQNNNLRGSGANTGKVFVLVCGLDV